MGQEGIKLNTFRFCKFFFFFFFFQRISCTGDAQLFFPQVTSEQAADSGKDRKLKTKFRIPLFLAGNRSENSYIVPEMCSAEERGSPVGLMESHPSLVSNQALLSAGPHLLFSFTPLVRTYVSSFSLFLPQNRFAMML